MEKLACKSLTYHSCGGDTHVVGTFLAPKTCGLPNSLLVVDGCVGGILLVLPPYGIAYWLVVMLCTSPTVGA